MRSFFRSILLLLTCTPILACAALNVNVDKGNIKPSTFVMGYFTKTYKDNPYQVEEVIINDLAKSGFFQFLGYSDDNVNTSPDIAEYRSINAVLLVTGEVAKSNGSNIKVYVRVWDIVMGRQIFYKVFTAQAKNWRRIGHIISDEIYKRVTGYPGYFDSRVFYVSETGDFFHRKKRLAVMDQDGFNNTYLTNGAHMVLMPVVSPSGRSVMYVSYANRVPKVHIMDTRTKKSNVVGDFFGMTSAPKFHPHSEDLIALSISQSGHTDIYKMSLSNPKKKKRLTADGSINTSPSFSPDGRQIAFVSDRNGSQQIYVMNSDGSNQRRISHGYGQYSTPAWSPTGEYIAFTKIEEREFFIGIMKPNGNDERLIAKGYMVEGPSWAPNGRLIMYTKERPMRGNEKSSKLYTVDITGRNERVVETATDGSDPAWSELLT